MEPLRLLRQVAPLAALATLAAQSPLALDLAQSDWRARNAAALALATDGELGPAARDALLEFVATPSAEEAMLRAAEEPQRRGTPASAADLVDLPPLAEPRLGRPADLIVPFEPRELALFVLVRRGAVADDAVHAALIERALAAAAADDDRWSETLLEALGPRREATLAALRAVLEHRPERRAAARLLARLGPEGAALLMVVEQTAAEPLLRSEALAALLAAPLGAAAVERVADAVVVDGLHPQALVDLAPANREAVADALVLRIGRSGGFPDAAAFALDRVLPVDHDGPIRRLLSLPIDLWPDTDSLARWHAAARAGGAARAAALSGLRAELRSSPDDVVRIGHWIAALGPDEDLAAEIVRVLVARGDDVPTARAVALLAALGPVAVRAGGLPRLVAALDAPRVANDAVAALVALGPIAGEAAPALRDRAFGPPRPRRTELASALAAVNPESVADLVAARLLQPHGHPGPLIHDRRGVAAFAALLADAAPRYRRLALDELARARCAELSADGLVDRVLTALDDPDPALRARARRLLVVGGFATDSRRRIAAALAARVADPELADELRLEAARARLRCGPADPESAARIVALAARAWPGQFSAAPVRPLEDDLAASVTRCELLRHARALPDTVPVRAFVERACEDDSPQVRAAARWALWDLLRRDVPPSDGGR
jgi:hypothetical protein